MPTVDREKKGNWLGVNKQLQREKEERKLKVDELREKMATAPPATPRGMRPQEGRNRRSVEPRAAQPECPDNPAAANTTPNENNQDWKEEGGDAEEKGPTPATEEKGANV